MRRAILMVQILLCLLSIDAWGNGFSLDSLKRHHVWMASQVIPGSGQLINRDYLKIPVFYAGMGTMGYLGYKANMDYRAFRSKHQSMKAQPYYGPEEIERYNERFVAKRMERNLYYGGLYAFYVASIADALITHAGDKHCPTTATFLSVLLPGLGQVYNQKYWKVPVIYGGIATIFYVIDFNHRGYMRFRTAYQYKTDNNPDTFNDLSQSRSRDDLLYFKDTYQRNRDLSVLILTGFYILNIIDANVDAHFFDWNVNDDLSFKIEPYIETPRFVDSRSFTALPGLRFTYNF